ncbi:MAG: FG-GAP-like repeat-containing protein [Acidimicrobiales bacterium]
MPEPSGEVRLQDVADEVGLAFQHGAFRWEVTGDPVAMMGGGVCWIDYDDDGWLDLYVVNSYAQREAGPWRDEGGLPRNALFHNVDGHFVDVSEDSGTDVAVRGTGCVAADLDLDGRTDLYVTTAETGVLLWNEGDGSFAEGAAAAGLDAPGWYAGAAVGDVDRDGWPDLFLAGYANVGSRISGATLGFPNTHTGVRDLLYLSDGAASGSGRPTFREVGRDAGLEVVNFEYGLGAMFSDLDRDDDLDLYVANDTKPNRLYLNVPWPGGAAADPAGIGFRFEEAAARAGVADPNAGMGVAAADYDTDGRTDLFVSNARGQVHGLYHGQVAEGPEGTDIDPSFADVRRDVGPDLGSATGWGASWADLDLDTDVDLVVANGDIPVEDLAADAESVQALVNRSADGQPGRFEDHTAQLGLADVGPLLARGSAAADYDNDGDLDVAVATIGGPLALLENRGRTGRWLEVDLATFAPGATVTAVLPDGRSLVRELCSGASYLSSEDPRAHFGLGTADTVERLVIRWPGGEETVLRDLRANQLVEVDAP